MSGDRRRIRKGSAGNIVIGGKTRAATELPASGSPVSARTRGYHRRMAGTRMRHRVVQHPGVSLAAHRAQVLEVARQHGATNVRVFGSVARGEDTAASDVDLLVDFPPRTSLLTVIGLEQAISEILGVPVDVGPADALRADLRDEVLAEAKPL